MITRPFYVQVLVVSFGGLILFALLGAIASTTIGDDRYNKQIFQKSIGLAEHLLPPVGSAQSDYQTVVSEIATKLDLSITLYGSDGFLIAASDEPASWIQSKQPAGVFERTDNRRRWSGQLVDGRLLILDLDKFPLPSENISIAGAFVSLALLIAALLWPLTRLVTRRLETLQAEVELVGAGDLSARVTVEGADEISKLAASFNRSTETIADLIQRQKLLLANASHELRTPLARIRMGIELLEQRDTEQRRSELRRDIRELDELIDDLISMTRYDTGGAMDRYELVNLLALAQEECRTISGCSVEGEPLEIEGDRRMLLHLIRNLVENAQIHGELPVKVKIEHSKDTISLIVEDAGTGIADGDQEKVFEPFYRGNGRQNLPGYGLGLPLVARIAHAHNADIEIQNTPKSVVLVNFSNNQDANMEDY
ncbi:MAG: HAMP domain-containing sensor histidine kinase [Pseudomonadota bacterium]